jgi:ATPase subunit of ABC transporter with duplicated ATPase domains
MSSNCVCVIGKNGDGKSNLLNNLLNEDKFHSEKTLKVLTKDGFWLGDKNKGSLTCIDTPVNI